MNTVPTGRKETSGNVLHLLKSEHRGFMVLHIIYLLLVEVVEVEMMMYIQTRSSHEQRQQCITPVT